MPKRADIKKILVLGAGPITIGQSCEFDYSGTQACKALKEEGFQVVLVNSNPATIMTDPEMAYRTYIVPLTLDAVKSVIVRERPDACLPTMGGQTSLNLAVQLAESGIFEQYGIELIGAKLHSISLAEDREQFKAKMLEIGLAVPNSVSVRNLAEIEDGARRLGFPIIVRPSFTLGGAGGGIAETMEELIAIAKRGLSISPIQQVLLEESVLGWKEIELEVVRDCMDNVVVVCSIENVDPMGIHTGDSITVAPVQTLTDKEYQQLRTAAIKVIRAVGVDTGGANVQFAINQQTGRILVVEVNPRVSRSSALASKATGYPIAKVAAKLAVGLTLDEIANDVTGTTPASFEPTIDYVVTKIPRFNFEKFPGADTTLTTEMKSVGEVMAIGRTFQESIQKGLRSLEVGLSGFIGAGDPADLAEWRRRLSTPSQHRLVDIFCAFDRGITADDIGELTRIDPWFIDNLYSLWEESNEIRKKKGTLIDFDRQRMLRYKQLGFSDQQIAELIPDRMITEHDVFEHRRKLGVQPSYRMVDTCASEFAARTPYFYSTYGEESEVSPSTKPKVLILGSGPNRIGQGIEFDYCCVQASLGLRDLGYESIMVNSNPETVSTDPDVSDRLYFEPLTLEDVTNIVSVEKPVGVVVQMGGQTPLKLAQGLCDRGIAILGTSAESVHAAEDRACFSALLRELGLRQPPGAIAYDADAVERVAEQIGFPLLVRPSYVLGGQSMRVIHSQDDLKRWLLSVQKLDSGLPLLIDRFLENAVELEVDALCDGKETVIAGIMEHIEPAGVHSGDSSCILPPQNVPTEVIQRLRRATREICHKLKVVGLANIQFAVREGDVYVLDVNPRASRTMPFVSKATGIPWARLAAKVLVGKSIRELGIGDGPNPPYVAVKSVVIPYRRFSGSQIALGPEMRSTGEVMGIGREFVLAFAQAQVAAGNVLPTCDAVLMCVSDNCDDEAILACRLFANLGCQLTVLGQGSEALRDYGLPFQTIDWNLDDKPGFKSLIESKQISLLVSLTRQPDMLDQFVREALCDGGVTMVFSLSVARAVANAMGAIGRSDLRVLSLQEYHALRSCEEHDSIARRATSIRL